MIRRAVLLALLVLITGCHTERRFAAPDAPLRDHWVILQVMLRTPIEVPGEAHAVGYYRNLGVRCAPERLKRVLETEVKDDTIVWDKTKWSEVAIDELDEIVRERTIPVSGEGIWYRSGRLFFPDESKSDSAPDKTPPP